MRKLIQGARCSCSHMSGHFGQWAVCADTGVIWCTGGVGHTIGLIEEDLLRLSLVGRPWYGIQLRS